VFTILFHGWFARSAGEGWQTPGSDLTTACTARSTRGYEAMNARAKKPASTLETMIMAQVQKHPVLSDVLNVHVGVNPEKGQPNWRAEFVMDRSRHAPQKAFDIANALGRDFDSIF
jgi:hypothetical protein